MIDDYIKRSDALNLLLAYAHQVDNTDTLSSVITNLLDNIPAADVEPKQRWIPVTERLPENVIPVNIVWVNHAPESYYAIRKDKPFVATGIYHRGTWYWWSTTTEDYLNEYGRCEWGKVDGAIEITHWMPLPEPQKGDDE